PDAASTPCAEMYPSNLKPRSAQGYDPRHSASSTQATPERRASFRRIFSLFPIAVPIDLEADEFVGLRQRAEATDIGRNRRHFLVLRDDDLRQVTALAPQSLKRAQHLRVGQISR